MIPKVCLTTRVFNFLKLEYLFEEINASQLFTRDLRCGQKARRKLLVFRSYKIISNYALEHSFSVKAK